MSLPEVEAFAVDGGEGTCAGGGGGGMLAGPHIGIGGNPGNITEIKNRYSNISI